MTLSRYLALAVIACISSLPAAADSIVMKNGNKIIGDFYMSLRFVNNYDSHPLGDAPNNDYNFVTALGWEY